MLTSIAYMNPGDFVIDHGRVAKVEQCDHGRKWYRFVGFWEDGCMKDKRCHYVIDYSCNIHNICCGGKR